MIKNDIEIQEELNKLIPDIKKYYNIGSWNSFKRNDENKGKMLISLIKSILKIMNVKYKSISCKLKDDNYNIINSTIYTIINTG